MLRDYNGVSPRVAESAFVSEQAYLVGEVRVGNRASCWPFVCLRGDGGPVIIGADSNVQEFSMLHGTEIGARVTVGHNATLDYAIVGDDSLIGIGSMVLDGATVEPGSIVAAGCLVPEGRTVPSGHLAYGVPAETRPLSDEHQAEVRRLGEHYVELSREYKAAGRFE